MRRIAAAIAAAAMIVGTTTAMVAPATPVSAAGACPGTDSGVTVVVDFAGLGGGVQVRCAPGDPSSGLAALQAAGFGWTGTAQMPGFVCRIDGAPPASQEACQVTPSTDAYWAYHHASRGGSWTYSSAGAGSRNPAPGGVEGWAFGSGGSPGVAPPAAPKPPPPPPPPPPKPPPAPSSGGGSDSGGGSSDGGSSGGPAPDRSSDGSGDRSPDDDSGSGDRDDGTEPSEAPESERPGQPEESPGETAAAPGGAGPATGSDAAADPLPAAQNSTDGGGVVGVLIAVGLVAALSTGAVWVHRRRQRTLRDLA